MQLLLNAKKSKSHYDQLNSSVLSNDTPSDSRVFLKYLLLSLNFCHIIGLISIVIGKKESKRKKKARTEQ